MRDGPAALAMPHQQGVVTVSIANTIMIRK